MIKRTLCFSNPAYLSLTNHQLVVKLPEVEKSNLTERLKKEATTTIPIEDIGVVVLDHQQITLTQGLLAHLLECNCAVITCDSRHLPVGLQLPLEGNTTQSERFRDQIEASLPLKKQLWQQTIQQKIANQAAVLNQKRGLEVKNMMRWVNEEERRHGKRGGQSGRFLLEEHVPRRAGLHPRTGGHRTQQPAELRLCHPARHRGPLVSGERTPPHPGHPPPQQIQRLLLGGRHHGALPSLRGRPRDRCHPKDGPSRRDHDRTQATITDHSCARREHRRATQSAHGGDGADNRLALQMLQRRIPQDTLPYNGLGYATA